MAENSQRRPVPQRPPAGQRGAAEKRQRQCRQQHQGSADAQQIFGLQQQGARRDRHAERQGTRRRSRVFHAPRAPLLI
ncbi:hypothetical protein AK51_21150 [Serratia nematodiphila DZ0503SBS1]|nr:hypothetical protein AK51_21150 [Serratia nematodiphila DZ0503SBS1]